MTIYTRTGDTGETGLFGGSRVPKSDARVAAYGDVDELNAVIGVALATDPVEFEQSLLRSIQRDLFGIGAQLASPNPAKVAKALKKADVAPGRIADLERSIDGADQRLKPLEQFVLPGGTQKAAHLHHARTVCRRAERSVVALGQSNTLPDFIVPYLNRLSDLLFTLARLANASAGIDDESW